MMSPATVPTGTKPVISYQVSHRGAAKLVKFDHTTSIPSTLFSFFTTNYSRIVTRVQKFNIVDN